MRQRVDVNSDWIKTKLYPKIILSTMEQTAQHCGGGLLGGRIIITIYTQFKVHGSFFYVNGVSHLDVHLFNEGNTMFFWK